MSDALTIINKVIAEHQLVREHVKLTGDRVNDIEALFTLHKAHSGWTQSSSQTLITKQNELQQAVSFLEQGLKNHFAFEEEALSPLFGELLMKALRLEHEKFRRQIASAKAMLATTKLEGLGQQELLAKKSQIQQAINDLCQMVEEHAGHEEIMLKMIKKALEGS